MKNKQQFAEVHYSKLQLFIGNREFPPLLDLDKPRTVPYACVVVVVAMSVLKQVFYIIQCLCEARSPFNTDMEQGGRPV